ncbi:MAG: hypothetical protein ACP6IY_19345 [Promethearchaeia archaeon]
MVKKSSINRIFSQYQNIDIIDITRIQSAYANKDASTIKKIFKKPKISDATALAYGRLANQYIKILNNPSKQTQSFVKKKYNVVIGSNFQDNLLLLGNLQQNYRKKKKSVSFPKILELNGYVNLLSTGYETIIPINFQSDINTFWNLIDFNLNEEHFIIQHGIKYYRVYLYIKFKNGRIGIISSKKVVFPNYRLITDIYYNAQQYIATNTLYSWQSGTTEEIIEEIQEIIKIRVRWWN